MENRFNPFDSGTELLTLPVSGSSTVIIPSYERKPFVEANTQPVEMQHLQYECIIPVFAKDNERTISHQEFIDASIGAATNAFSGAYIAPAEIRVSHQIKGRTPDAIHKPVNQLMEHEKTVYYERMAFIVRIPSIIEEINGNHLALTIGGVRSYSLENLYQKKSLEKFKFFIGFQNMVCCNLCVSSDGFVEEMRASSFEDLYNQIYQVIISYRAELHLQRMKRLGEYSLTEHQFAQLIGRCRLYQYLPKEQKKTIPLLAFNDGQLNTVAKDYYEDSSFARDEYGDINLWNLYNLFTQANKSSYIDTFLNRNLNALEVTVGVQSALDNSGSGYGWFLS